MRQLFLAILFPLLLISAAAAQTPWPDSTALDAYMDGLVNTYMEENNIAGATVSITKDGEPVLLKGYGEADVENDIEVNPDSTLFRIGSISKLFVWTAVMQLVKEDQLDLDEDINQYLEDFQIPDTYEEPVTLRHLMTHSAGFEEYIIGLFARDTTRLHPLGDILSEEMPARVRPPGIHSSYSNHGTGMAAYVVEHVFEMSFEDYVEERIFEPLEMNQSTFRQPLPSHLSDQMSKGYAFEGGEYKEKDFEYVPLGPVGTASTTAADMINFIQANLQYGQFRNTAVLDSATTALMQSPAFRHAPGVNPMRHGFIDMSQNGVEIIGHGGDTFWFHSLMALFPNHDLGFFISFNSVAGGTAKGELLEDFVDYYFPEENIAADTLKMADEELQRFAGSYRANRYPHARFTYLLALLGSDDVNATEDGMLKTIDSGEANYWFPVDSLTFRNTENSDVLAFEENDEGEVTHMFRSGLPIIAFEKVPFISGQTLHFIMFGTAGIAFLVTTFYWPLAYCIRKRYRPGAYARPPLSLPKKTAAWLNGLVILAFFIWMGTLLSQGNGEAIVYGVAGFLKAAFALPFISVFLTIVMGYNTYELWTYRESGIWSRIWYTNLFILSVTMLWQLYYWNLLGFKF